MNDQEMYDGILTLLAEAALAARNMDWAQTAHFMEVGLGHLYEHIERQENAKDKSSP